MLTDYRFTQRKHLSLIITKKIQLLVFDDFLFWQPTDSSPVLLLVWLPFSWTLDIPSNLLFLIRRWIQTFLNYHLCSIYWNNSKILCQLTFSLRKYSLRLNSRYWQPVFKRFMIKRNTFNKFNLLGNPLFPLLRCGIIYFSIW